MRAAKIVILAVLTPMLAGAAPGGGDLRIEVANVRSNAGKVHVDICTAAQFLKKCSFSAEARAVAGVTVVTIPAIPPGRYAAQVTFDENGNGKVDRALFGVPKEGVGFSNDAKINFGPPRFADAQFDYDGRGATIRVNLRYFLGPKSAPAQ